MYTKGNLRYYRTVSEVNQLVKRFNCQLTIPAVTKHLGYIRFLDQLLLHLPHSLT